MTREQGNRLTFVVFGVLAAVFVPYYLGIWDPFAIVPAVEAKLRPPSNIMIWAAGAIHTLAFAVGGAIVVGIFMKLYEYIKDGE